MTDDQLERAIALREELRAVVPASDVVCRASEVHQYPIEIHYGNGVIAQLDDLPGLIQERIGNAICSIIRSEHERLAEAFRRL